MQIIHVSAECFPIAKVGGLADVVGALPKYQEASGISSKVIMPFYDNKFTQLHINRLEEITLNTVALGNQDFSYNILKVPSDILGFDVFLVKIVGLTDKQNVYGYANDVERFTAFQKITCDFLLDLEEKPSVVHCHDHHTGFVPFFMSYGLKYGELKKVPSVLTIHNAQYQKEWEDREAVYQARFDQAQNDSSKVIIHENLTETRANMVKVLGQLREKGQVVNYHTKNGMIYARNSRDKKYALIEPWLSEDDVIRAVQTAPNKVARPNSNNQHSSQTFTNIPQGRAASHTADLSELVVGTTRRQSNRKQASK